MADTDFMALFVFASVTSLAGAVIEVYVKPKMLSHRDKVYSQLNDIQKQLDYIKKAHKGEDK